MSLGSFYNGRITSSVDDEKGIVEFFHEKANCLTSEMLTEMALTIKELSENKNINVILIKSSGNGAFCAGASFAEFDAAKSVEDFEQIFSGVAAVLLSIIKSPKLVVARVQGKAVGGGIGILSACDYVLASNEASIRFSEYEHGLVAATIAPVCANKLGNSAFSAASIDCEWRDANWCVENHLFSKISPSAELDMTVSSFIQTLATRSQTSTFELKSLLRNISFPSLPALESAIISGTKISANLLWQKRK